MQYSIIPFKEVFRNITSNDESSVCMMETEAPSAFRHVITGKKARLHSRLWHCSQTLQQQLVDLYSLC